MRFILSYLWGVIVGVICYIAGYGLLQDGKLYLPGTPINIIMVIIGILIINILCDIRKK